MISNNSLSKSMCVSYLQSSNMSHDGRLTVVRPSFDCRSKLLKLVSVLVILLTVGVGNVWGTKVSADLSDIAIDNDWTTSAGSDVYPYTEWDLDANISVSVNASGNNGSYWGTDGWKVYESEDAVVTITAASGYTISSVTITYKSTKNSGCLSELASNTEDELDDVTSVSYTVSHSSGTKKGQIGITAISVTYASSGGSTPTLTKSSSMTTLTYSSGSPVAQSFTIGGSNLTNDVTVTAPTNYEVCKTSGGTYTSSVSFTNTEVNAANKTVYIRLQSGLSGGNIASSNVTIASTGATSQTVAVTGSVPYTITWMANGNTHATTYVTVGSTLALPATDPVPNSCGCTGKAFYGWYGAGSSYSNASVAPTIAKAGDAVSADKTYYAVFADEEDGSSTSTLTASAQGWSDGNNATTKTISTVTYTWAQNSGSSAPKYYATGTAVRLYPQTSGTNGCQVTISSANTITGVAFTYVTDYEFLTNAPSVGTLTAAGVWSGSATSITFKNKNNAQVRIQSIVVTYGSTTYSNYATSCCTPLGTINGSINMSSSTDGTVTISDWTYAAGSTGTTESNVSSYTVMLYKLTGTSPDAWTIVSGSTSGGSSGTQGTRTGIATNSKSVTYSGLEYGATYKFTVTAIGTGSYCDGPETAVTSINSNALTNNKFLNKYYIHIDDGTNSDSGWEDYYFTSLTSHAGSVDVTLNAFTDYYQYKLSLGGVIWWGNNSKMTSSDHTNWTLYTAQGNVKLQTAMGGTYTFGLNAATPAVTVTYPTSNQESGYHIYFDNSILEWSTLRYRIGNNSHNQNSTLALVTGTDNFYVATTPSYDGMEAWHIANNTGWADSHTIYRTATNNESGQPEIAITASIVFQQYKVTEDITVIPTTSHTTGTDNTGDKVNNQCEFYTINTPTSGMLTHTATISATTNGSINLAYTDVSGTSQNKTSTTSSLAHRTKITASAIPSTGYEISTFTVTPSGGDATNLTSGATDNHILAKDATFAATFSAKTYSIDLDREGATTGSTSVTMTYNSATHTSITSPSKDGYTFGGWWSEDNGTGSMVMNASGVLQANVDGYTGAGGVWIKDATCTLYAKWTEVLHNVTVAYKCGDATLKISTTINNVGITTTGSTTAPDINGYTWSTWSAMPNGVTTSTTPLTTKTIVINATADSKTITANYTANQYVVTLDANGGVDGATTSVTTTFGQAMPTISSVNLPTREGYRFDGFYTGKTDGTKYYNADGTSARNQGRWSDNQKLYAHWVAQLTFSVNGVIDDELTRDDNTAMPSTATVPTACGDCWAFMGWSTNSSESGAPAYAGGATHEFGEPTTLYAVFGKAEYEWISSISGLVANDYYVLTNIVSSKEYAISNTAHPTLSNDASSTDVTDKIRENAAGYILYNPAANNIWKFTGTKDAGQLYNAASSKYLNLSGSGSILSTSNNLTFTLGSNGQWTINSTKYLRHYSANDWDAAASLTSGDFSCYLYHQTSAEYATEPSCETYNIVWKVNGTPLVSDSQTEETNACAGIEELPTDPDDDELDCATKFMGWSEYTLTGTGKSAPADLFTNAADAPAIDADKTFHAVFASTIGTAIAPIEDSDFSGAGEKDEEGSYCGLSYKLKTVGKYLRKQSIWTSSDMTNVKVRIRVYHVSNNTADVLRVSLIDSDGNEVVGADLSTNKHGTNSTSAGYSNYVELTPTSAVTGYKVSMKTSNSYGTGINKIEREVIASGIKDYVTTCCDELVTLTTNSPANGTITFEPAGPIATCEANQNVTMTITPSPGYKLSDWSVATGDGKVAAANTTPAVVTGEDNSDEQEITLTFSQHTTGNYDVSATFEQMHDEYFDYMHDNAKVGPNRTGVYPAPSRTSKTAASGEDCKTNHYKFKGWVVQEEINDDGTLKSGYTLITAGSSMTASNKIYYAVWAEEE